MKFSERIGVIPVETAIQTREMNDDLKNSLWNMLDIFLWGRAGFVYVEYGRSDIHDFSSRLWINFFKKPMDLRSSDGYAILNEIRNYYFQAKWNEVYDFLEYILKSEENLELIEAINVILERELAGYRYIGSAFVPITDEVEIEAVQQAATEDLFRGVHSHLKKAIECLARRENPDYRNSIKESISAVESMAKEITGNPKATLGDALSLLERNHNLHPALKSGFSAIYGYTSDEGGIRHAMLNEPNITATDAKFFLVLCSSFINFLKVKIV